MMLLAALDPVQVTEIYWKIAGSIATTFAVVIAGGWAIYKYIIQRENHSLIDFTVDIVFHHKKDGFWIVELIAFIENRGKVQHKIQEFGFDLASLNAKDPVVLAQQFGNQVFFPNTLVQGSFLPSTSKYFFNEPGLKNKYSFITRVPVDAEVIIMHSWFKYLDGIHSHSAERTMKVPADADDVKNAPVKTI